jgi:DTW domain-containing protein YfiP
MKDTQTPAFKFHQVDLLRQYCTSISTRPFLARGAKLTRCQHCLMSQSACFCHSRKTLTLPIDLVLLYHRDEIHKPTNSGRLIADLFPDQTHAFLWSRKEPNEALVNLLEDKNRQVMILFPDKSQKNTHFDLSVNSKLHTGKKITLVLLDSTWKQASKMFHSSLWLRQYPSISINMAKQKAFLVRHAKHDMQFATAEVSAMALNIMGYEDQAHQLMQYNAVFNQHCLMSRNRAG